MICRRVIRKYREENSSFICQELLLLKELIGIKITGGRSRIIPLNTNREIKVQVVCSVLHRLIGWQVYKFKSKYSKVREGLIFVREKQFLERL